MTKKELAAVYIARLKAEYPASDCTLDYDHAWQLLVSVRLAAQCTDARVNVVVQELFARVVKRGIEEQGWQPILDTVKELPCDEDFE